jgi:hypothetical protein
VIHTHSNKYKEEDGRGTAKAWLPLILSASYIYHVLAFPSLCNSDFNNKLE